MTTALLLPPAAAAAAPRPATVGHAPARTPAATLQVEPPPRIPAGARALGAVDPAAPQQGAVVLKPRDAAALQSFLAGVTDRHSPLYHHYLSAGAYAARFGPTPSTVDSVRGWLLSEGLRVTSVERDGLLVDFEGTAARVERAFGTTLQRYRLADGTAGQSTAGPIEVPAPLAGAVTAVAGLDDLVRPRPLHILHTKSQNRSPRAPVPAGFTHPAGAPAPCHAAAADALAAGGLTDDQIANSYGAFGLYGVGDLGAGQAIAVYELEPVAPPDVLTFDTCYFGAAEAAAMQSRLTLGGPYAVDGGQPAGPGSGESILDVEDVSAIAPAATIDVYEAPNTAFAGLDEWSRIVNDDAASIVSTSWGACEQAIQLAQPGQQQAENELFEQAAAQGQSIFSAEGDTGDDSCNAFRGPPPAGQNLLSVLDPSSQPYVVSVGGTTITAATDPPAERVWNDGGPGGAGGGGISESWAMPSWQRNLLGSDPANVTDVGNAEAVENGIGQSANGPAGDFATPTFCAPPGTPPAATYCREAPDVSAQADEAESAVTVYSSMFVVICGCDGWVTIGGTSSATPIWAALLALAAASEYCTASAHGLGFVTPILYGIAANPLQHAASFNDVTVGNNDVYEFDEGLVFPARGGYDMASGLGSPRLTGAGGSAGLAYYACSAAGGRASRPGVTGLSPAVLGTAGSAATSTPVTIDGSGFESGGSPDVAAVEVGTFSLEPSAYTVTGPGAISATFPPAADTLSPGARAPQDGAGPADVVVTLTDGQSSTPGASSVLQYVDESGSAAAVPSVTGVSPAGGSEAGPCPTPGPTRCVTIFGSGFANATAVTFGGVPASFATVPGRNDYEIVATPPPFVATGGGAEQCAPLPSGSGLTSTNDICQVQVQVTNGAGSSARGTILPPYEGATLSPTPMGPPAPPAGCGCELVAAPTEFDYEPTPTITGVSTVLGPTLADADSLASEFVLGGVVPGTLVTVTGSGFDPLTLMWADLGDPSLGSSMDGAIVYATGTTVQFVASGLAPLPDGQIPFSVDPVAVPLRMLSLAGLSAPENIWYAGIPQVASVTNTANPRRVGGLAGAPATGGAPISLVGAGFADQLVVVGFLDSAGGPSFGSTTSFTESGDTGLATDTVYQPPATVDVQACTVTACSERTSTDRLVLYEPSDATVDSVAPSSGPARGGTAVDIGGQNLGCVTGVFFGSVKAASFGNVTTPHGLDCGTTDLVQAVAPPGLARSSVAVTVTTIESDFAGSGPSASTATFTYAPSPPSAPRGLAGTAGPGSASIHWAPPADDGGSQVTGYRLTAQGGSASTISLALPPSAHSYFFPELDPGYWTFSLSAVSALGIGPSAVLGSQFGGFFVPPGDNGYAVCTANGAVFTFGSMPAFYGPGGGRLPSPVVGLALGTFGGWYEAAADGTVYGLAGDISLGNAPLSPGTRVVGIASTPDGLGYWLVANDGAVYSFGNAHYRGRLRGVQDVVGIAADPGGIGYYVAEGDGAVHAFGAAHRDGDLAGHQLSRPIVAITVNPVTGGYWLLGGDGGVFSFGGAGYHGSLGGRHLNAAVTGMVGTPDGSGYWLVAGDNGVFSFGTARYVGNPMGVAESAGVAIGTF